MNYKAVRLNRTSHYDRATHWPEHEGAIVSAGDGDFTLTENGCGPGIHSSPALLQAVSFQDGPSIYLAVEPIDIIQTRRDKTRSKAVRIDHWLTPKETDELAGFKLWEANHPVNPLELQPKPFSDDELTELVRQWASAGANVWAAVQNSVGTSVRDSFGAAVQNSVRIAVRASFGAAAGASVRAAAGASFGASAWASAWTSVWDSAGAAIWAYTGGLFPGITSWKGVERLGPDPWRPLLTLWYGGYLPTFDSKIWRLHTGPAATVVWEGKL